MSKILLVSSNSIHLFIFYDLIKNDFEDILVVTNGNKSTIDKTIYVRFSLKNPLYFIKSIIKIRNIINNYKPDIIHCHQITVVSLVTVIAKKISKLKNVPVVATAWGSDILVNSKKNFLYKFLIKTVLNNIDFLTTSSLHIAFKVRSLVKKSNFNIKIANFGVEFLGQDLNVYSKENLIFSSRNHKDLYRIEDIIIGFNNFIKTQNNEWKLIIGGTGEKTQNYKELVNKLKLDKYVIFTGWLDKQTYLKYYIKSKIFISIPKSDASSTCLLEAMYYGCIPIVSYIPSNMEWIIDGLNGIINENPKNLDKSIIEALNLDFEYCAQINKKIIEMKATKEINEKIFINIYENLLGKTLCKK